MISPLGFCLFDIIRYKQVSIQPIFSTAFTLSLLILCGVEGQPEIISLIIW